MGDELGEAIAITRAAVTRLPYPILTIVGATATFRSRAGGLAEPAAGAFVPDVKADPDRSSRLRSLEALLLNILYLLANPLELRFQLDDILRQGGVIGLRTDRVGLAAQLLK